MRTALNYSDTDVTKYGTRGALGAPITTSVANYANLEPNIQRIIRVMDEDVFEELFPVRRDVYSYRGFLEAAVKYPTFCAEKNDGDNDIKTKSLDEVCKRELASMFAHFAQEVGAHVGGTPGNVAVPTAAVSGNDNQGKIT